MAAAPGAAGFCAASKTDVVSKNNVTARKRILVEILGVKPDDATRLVRASGGNLKLAGKVVFAKNSDLQLVANAEHIIANPRSSHWRYDGGARCGKYDSSSAGA